MRDKKKRKYVTKKLVKKTILRCMSNIKSYIHYLVEHKILFNNPVNNIILPKWEETLKPDITQEDIEKLVSVIDTSNFLGYRDRTLIELIYSTGIRRMEACNLDVYDIDFKEGILKVRKGKGSKDRLIPLGEVIQSYLKEYLTKVRKYLVNIDRMDEQALFISHNGSRLTKGTISSIVRIYARKAGVYHLQTHKLRHACALHMMKKGCDIRYIQQILGHEFLETTTVYTQVFDYDLKEKILKHHPRDHDFNEEIDIEKIKKICKIK